MSRPPAAAAALLLAAPLAVAPRPAAAAPTAVGGSVAVVSDDRYRGISASDGRPDLRLALALDHASGGYAGAVLLQRLRGGSGGSGFIVYAGLTATPASSGLHWEAGGSWYGVAAGRRVDDRELYAGLVGERWTLRLHGSPDYFGSGRAAGYLEWDASWPLAPGWTAAAHIGRLQGAGGGRSDLRLTLGLRAAGIDWQLAAAGAGSGGPASYGHDRATLLLAATWSF